MRPSYFSFGLVTYTWRCRSCVREGIETRMFRCGDEIWRSPLPAGWTMILVDGFPEFVCPDHTVVTLIDGKVLNERSHSGEVQLVQQAAPNVPSAPPRE